MEYGCIGEKLTHSFSKEIHNLLFDYDYKIQEIPKGELHGFMTKKDFKAINVTIPYKQDVIPYLDFVSETATKIGMPTVGIYDQYNFDQERMKQIATKYIAKGETLRKLIH